jgi:multimeric flavodoxin WrbA
MKTVILFGSPRKNGNTIQLVNVLSDIIKRKRHSVRMLYLNDMNIRPCQGCYACLKKGVCKINDDMKDIRKYIMESDLIVYAFPIYWFAPSSQLKLVIDRSIAFMDENYNSRIKGKKAITLMTCGDEDKGILKPAKEMFKMTFDLLKLSYIGSVEATGCQEKGEVKRAFKEKTRKLAESIA